ncbi:MAG: RHS repeat-associated core domain-containing protein [Oscillospiraceae bacterium]|nr:RHS repeat-associated core domain-containing protein [Oscillospiraceae bacterium]
MLTAYNGETITYDAIGNPLSYRSGMTFGWEGGRKLTSFSTPNAAGNYVYNADGIRVYKEVNGNTTEYYLNGTQIQTEITNFGGVTRRVDYIYDENGSIYGFVVDNTAKYYYTKNLQGDIIGILDASGTTIVEYSYDAWGKATVSYPNADSLTKAQKQANYFLGSNNPFRYRGYYFDNETGFYYLNSRYYDPEVGRFINADIVMDTESVFGFNLFSYCENNPITYIDDMGYGRTYVIYYNDPKKGFKTQAYNSPYYNKCSRNVSLIGVTSINDFITAWNNIEGSVDYIYLYLHGGRGTLYFKGETLGFSGEQSFSKLKQKKVNLAVYLFSCHGGNGSEGNNVAWMLAKRTGSKVYACTGSVSYSKVFGKYYARKAFDFGIIKTFYYQRKYIWWGSTVAKTAPGQW